MLVKKRYLILLILINLFLYTATQAFTTTTIWAPSTTACQQFAVPHLSLYTYFADGPPIGEKNAPALPIASGLLIGYLPFDKIQADIGADLLYPTPDPLVLNSKICTPESSWFERSPGMAFGIYNLGFDKDVNDHDILYGVLQESIPGDGYIAIGAYHGMNKKLFTNSDNNVVQNGLIAGIWSPDITINREGLKRINFVADIQTGKNVMGAWALGVYFFASDYVSFETGPTFFFDPALQPGQRNMLWAFQLDIDFPLSAASNTGKSKFNKRALKPSTF